MESITDNQARELARQVAENPNMTSLSPVWELHQWARDALADEYGITKPRKSLVAYVAQLARLEWQLLITQTKARISKEA